MRSPGLRCAMYLAIQLIGTIGMQAAPRRFNFRQKERHCQQLASANRGRIKWRSLMFQAIISVATKFPVTLARSRSEQYPGWLSSSRRARRARRAFPPARKLLTPPVILSLAFTLIPSGSHDLRPQPTRAPLSTRTPTTIREDYCQFLASRSM